MVIHLCDLIVWLHRRTPGNVVDFRPIRSLEIILLHRYSETQIHRKSTNWQAKLYEQRLQKWYNIYTHRYENYYGTFCLNFVMSDKIISQTGFDSISCWMVD